jgi:hypothetical protein
VIMQYQVEDPCHGLCIRYKASFLMVVPREVLENIVPIVLSKLDIFLRYLEDPSSLLCAFRKRVSFQVCHQWHGEYSQFLLH